MPYPDEDRFAVLELLNQPTSSSEQISRALRVLYECDDVMPVLACDDLGLDRGSTYGEASHVWEPPMALCPSGGG